MRKPLAALAFLAVMAVMPALAQLPAPDSELCRSQLELLLAGGKLTGAEAERFENQCACLEAREQGRLGDGGRNCAERRP